VRRLLATLVALAGCNGHPLPEDPDFLRARVRRLEARCAELESERDGLREDLRRLTAHCAAVEMDLGDLRARWSAEERWFRVSSLDRMGVDLDTVVVPAPVPRIDGTVVAVKTDADPDLVLLSVGADHGVERGLHFSLYRGSAFVAKVIVERVLRDTCGCRVLFAADGQEILPGDLAATRLQ
jgi:hypothetical protein